MLTDADDNLRRVAVNKVQAVCGTRPRFDIENIGLEEDILCRNVTDNQTNGNVMENPSVRKFLLPLLNSKAKSFQKMVNLNEQGLQEQPALRNLTDIQLKAHRTFPLKMYNSCHNQAVEQHIKAVTEGSMQATGF